ncbi:MAG: exopolyphosphatase [Lysobacterales bacterium CG17_big_fil_post_rev_8_21_14_2_50_64_11]|nr:MAG: exopolyphosphatase [Xanthomonadales bacterium CG17_big_fil_post_rev_8_21_14_2_50_64_11]PIX61368.1 MAG: exopolyphosphatase [Xanthomonadales bacterium CG_4_10_14_3_um_filter_64_11]
MPDTRSKLQNGELLAAIDLGSNSFHMVVARYVLGQLRIVDRLRDSVRLAEGLDAHGGLHPEVLARALDALARLGQRIRTIPAHRVRAIATNSVRQLHKPLSFLVPAETALGHAIEVVSGREEARLIYLGVAHGYPPSGRNRLVIDIGGGSTEFIIGKRYEPLERESLQLGCIATTRRFFADGKLSKRRWREALTEISAEFQQFAAIYRERGWKEVYGSSGTIKAVGEIASKMKLSRGQISDTAVEQICDRLLGFDHVADIRLAGLDDDRRSVIAGGLLVLQAAFNELDLKRMQISKTAMREGILYDIIGRASDEDPREDSVSALMQRYDVDREQAQRVEATALDLFDQIAKDWELGDDDRRMLAWAARIHEVGLAIAHSQHHVHGAYLIEHSDIAGFSRQEQKMLSVLIRCQRRNLSRNAVDSLPDRLSLPGLRLIVLLRHAVLLHRGHERDALPRLKLKVDARTLELRAPRNWLDRHPLTGSDLDAEANYLADAGFALVVRSS